MINQMTFIILYIVVIVVLMIISSVALIIYKLIRSIKGVKIKKIEEYYRNQIFEVVNFQREKFDIEDFKILTDVISQYFSWVSGEEKTLLYNALKKAGFIDFLIEKTKKSNKVLQLKCVKVLGIVGTQYEIKEILDFSLARPHLLEVIVEAVFKVLSDIDEIEAYRVFVEVLFSNIYIYPEGVRRKIQFFAVMAGNKIKDVVFDVMRETKSEAVIITCLNILSEIASFEDIQKIEPFLDHSSPEIRAAVCKVFEKTGYISSVDKLINLIEKEKVYFVKLRALRALSEISEEDAVDYLLKSLEDEWFYIRDFAQRALSEFGFKIFDRLLEFYYKTGDRFAKDKIIEIFYNHNNFNYLIKGFLGKISMIEKEKVYEIFKILNDANQNCFERRLKDEGYYYIANYIR